MTAEVRPNFDHDYGKQLAKPLHIQSYEQALQIDPLLKYVEGLIKEPPRTESDGEETSEGELELLKAAITDSEGNKIVNGITVTKAERKADKNRLYNFGKVKKSRKWLKNILLSDSSSDEDDERPITREDLQSMLRHHKQQRKLQMQFYQENELSQYQYYSTGLLSNYDKYHEHQKNILGPKKKISKEQKKMERKLKAKLKKIKKEKIIENGEGDDDESSGEIDPAVLEAILAHQHKQAKGGKHKKLTPEQADAKRRKIWISIAKKEIPKAQKQKASARKEMLQSLKKISQQCMRECKRAAIQSQKTMKEIPSRARRLTREMLVYWKRFEKVEKEHRKRVEKEALEQRKMDLELKEARRQQRKLNFLITQTELYAHFMAKKLTGEATVAHQILNKLDEAPTKSQVEVDGNVLVDIAADEYDATAMKKLALKNAEEAFQTHQAIRQSFDDGVAKKRSYLTFANPEMGHGADKPQPKMFEGKLKCYQLKGMNWLVSLYDQGINGILADEMGLGKTVQSIACLAHLAEAQGIWGPFLIIAPASTLHNWQQEFSRFVSRFKVVPYWGNTQDRRILRKFWDQRCLHTEEASFHIVITSYQLIIQDVKYFQRIKWQYMILDEAQAIKSSSSARWKILLEFNCRNRLLLTGTPIQNSMAELWALLHFIMPTLFDSHDEFNEWFSKDIESHVERQSGIDENQLSRLHMILKPFMLRRVKKDVENELSDKIEILVYCPLTTRQRLLYQAIKNKISIEDLIHSATSNNSQSQSTTSSLMNLVMQFRKVCNHPELFERREVKSSLYLKPDQFIIPKLVFRDGILDLAVPSKRHLVHNKLYIHSPEYVHHSLFHPHSNKSSIVNGCYSFTRFINLSPAELYAHMMGGLLVRWLAVFLWLKSAYRIHHQQDWEIEPVRSTYLSKTCFLLEPERTTYFPNLRTSPNLQRLVFTSYTSTVYSHEMHAVHYIPETTAHRQIRLRNLRHVWLGKKYSMSPPHSPTKSPSKSHTIEPPELPLHPHKLRSPRMFRCQPTALPGFLYNFIPKVQAGCPRWYCVDRCAQWLKMKEELFGSLDARNSLTHGTPEIYAEVRWHNRWRFFPEQPGGLMGIQPKHGWSGIYVPDKETMVTDAGKLYVLDTLLQRLKDEGHRVLIYSQMTRMIDLLEEFMWHRKHTYMRLDGSSKISERRDMVADFQTRSDIFVFLLSTRAGGLGINLTAADTVIFYDSDWNPTVDQQAMDRAHRLGQTKQVTVYRLVCKGTIEERILQRAKEKSEIQRMVISGGNFRPDTLKPKEVVSLLIDDDEMENKLKQRQDDKYKKEDTYKEKDKKRKRDKYIKFSVGSEQTTQALSVTADDSSNDGLVIVDDAHLTFPPVSSQFSSTPKRGRGRGRPKGSGVGRGRPRGRGGAKKALSAAEIAGAQAGMTAAYAAYGYSLTGKQSSTLAMSGRSTPVDSPKSASPALNQTKNQ
ncbi:hypothetical protein ACJMK2_035930 [Sinanodonta woodiana]|uniref:Chromatin-remodeling ATPase INO80 n=1 Tax=Sinanodonta woodiana TaxID=1069815 RepID=A0ABD3WFL5_SINWO